MADDVRNGNRKPFTKEELDRAKADIEAQRSMQAIDDLVAKVVAEGYRILRSNTKYYLLTPAGLAAFQPTRDGKAEAAETITWGLRRAHVPVDAHRFKEAVAYMAHCARAADSEPVHVRVGERPGEIYIALHDRERRVVRVTAAGWDLVAEPACPVLFHRTPTMQPLPVPVPGGRIEALADHLGFDDPAVRVAVLGFACTLLKAGGTHLLLALEGPVRSRKTAATWCVSALVDPHDPQTPELDSDPRSVYAALAARWVFVVDESNGLTPDAAMRFANVATGGGRMGRDLYSNDGLHASAVCRPVVVNGHHGVFREPRIRSRALPLTLAPEPRPRWETDEAARRAFRDLHPALLGAFCDAASRALAHRGPVLPEELAGENVRMSDSVVWAEKMLQAVGHPAGAFARVVVDARKAAEEKVTAPPDGRITGGPVDDAILLGLLEVGPFDGRKEQLLARLNQTGAAEPQARGWPRSVNHLGVVWNRVKGRLAEFGLGYEEYEKTGGKAFIRFAPAAEPPAAD